MHHAPEAVPRQPAELLHRLTFVQIENLVVGVDDLLVPVRMVNEKPAGNPGHDIFQLHPSTLFHRFPQSCTSYGRFMIVALLSNFSRKIAMPFCRKKPSPQAKKPGGRRRASRIFCSSYLNQIRPNCSSRTRIKKTASTVSMMGFTARAPRSSKKRAPSQLPVMLNRPAVSPSMNSTLPLLQ